MQIKSLRIKSYRSWKIDDKFIPEIAKTREAKIKLYQKLRADGCKEKTALEAIGLTRSTFYRLQKSYQTKGIHGLIPNSKKPHKLRQRCWDKSIVVLITELRRANPLWGKEKIQRLLQREHNITTSVSTVGRIIQNLVKHKIIKAVANITGMHGKKRKRQFNKHAKRWQYGMKAKQPGELVQIDHMSIYNASKVVKHFKAVCPKSKWMVTEVYSNATSTTAKHFLAKVKKEMPFPILSIQVDGGSEFMNNFEQACSEEGIHLFVLPPKSPKYNGAVERCNGVTRNEFYLFYTGEHTVTAIRDELKGFQHKYNYYRPHRAINNLTPMEYYESHIQMEALQSQMY